nr:hypothetical protein HmN_000490300 [Hymenolepis microstoma]
MSHIKEDHEPPVSLGKKIKLAGNLAQTAYALGKIYTSSGNPNNDPSGKSEPTTKDITDLEELGLEGGHKLPREEWLFKGGIFHWTTIRFPIRKIAQIPECDIFKKINQYGDSDNVFLLDNLTMYPFTCWLADENTFNTHDDADLAFGAYKKWRVTRVHYKISQFRTVTTRNMVVSGQNKAITGEDATNVNTADFIRSSIYMGGAKVRAAAIGNPLFWEDGRWMNENSVVYLDYKFDDTYLGRTTWFKKLWNGTWSNTNNWGKNHFWIIPGINTTGDSNRTMIWEGRTGADPVKFFNFLNKNGPICLCVPRTGEYNSDESRPLFSASCLIEGYMDVQVAMSNWGSNYGRFGLQTQYRGANEVYMKYVLKESVTNKELHFGKFDLFWNNIDPSQP